MLSRVAALPFLTPPPSLILSNSTVSHDNVSSEYFRVANKGAPTTGAIFGTSYAMEQKW